MTSRPLLFQATSASSTPARPRALLGHALVNLVPNLGMLEPLFKACEKDPAARRSLVEGFTGDAPIYSLLKHPRALATALKEGVGRRSAPRDAPPEIPCPRRRWCGAPGGLHEEAEVDRPARKVRKVHRLVSHPPASPSVYRSSTASCLPSGP